jgi:hypothetical protein
MQVTVLGMPDETDKNSFKFVMNPNWHSCACRSTVDFTNCLALTHEDPKSAIRLTTCLYFFALYIECWWNWAQMMVGRVHLCMSYSKRQTLRDDTGGRGGHEGWLENIQFPVGRYGGNGQLSLLYFEIFSSCQKEC